MRALQRFRVLGASALALAAGAGPGGGGDIAWEPDWQAAFTRAAAEQRVVFLAVNMDGEKANDALAGKTYRDEMVTELTTRTVNLLASRFQHSGKACNRFPGLSCADHQKTDIRAREKVLKAGAVGEVVAPQHVWLDGEGKVLLSVAYVVTAEELAWCFVTAIRRVDPEADVKMPSGARAPRRLVVDGVAGGETVRPLTEEELEKALDAINKIGLGRERAELTISLLATDHPDAVEAIAKELSGSSVRGARGSEGALAELQASRRTLVHRIGVISPPSFWEAVLVVIEDEDAQMRSEAAAALEQLGAADALKDVRKALGAEKDARAERDFLRALGACGRGDSGTRKKLLQHVKDKDAGIRHNALFALGLHAGDKDAAAALHASFASADALDTQAALLGLATANESSQVEQIEKLLLGKGISAETVELAQRVIAVLKSEAPLAGLGEDVVRVCGDTVRRERFFPVSAAVTQPQQ
jgi:hypothetical protein